MREDRVSKEIDILRKEISKIDRKILDLLNKRAELSLKIGKLKKESKDSVFKPIREKDILAELGRINPGPLPKDHLYAIYREIFSSSRALQKPQTIAYLGPEGTFSYFAALHYFGHLTTYSPKNTIEDVFKAVKNKDAELGVIPLENSLEGTVGESLDMFLKYRVFIQAEIFYKISYAIISLSKHSSEIEVIYSHPKAIEQCSEWIKKNFCGTQIVPVESTAYGAQMALRNKKAAAITHPSLASFLGLNILELKIENSPNNWTRFLIIGSKPILSGKKDKTSMLFILPDVPGALAKVLNIFARENINLKKLESRPLKGKKWQYVFFCDVECDLFKKEYKNLLKEVKSQCEDLKLLGSYAEGPYIKAT